MNLSFGGPLPRGRPVRSRDPDPDASIYAIVAVGNQGTRERKNRKTPLKKKSVLKSTRWAIFFFFWKNKVWCVFLLRKQKGSAWRRFGLGCRTGRREKNRWQTNAETLPAPLYRAVEFPFQTCAGQNTLHGRYQTAIWTSINRHSKIGLDR